MILRELIEDKVYSTWAEPVFEENYDLIVIGLGSAGAMSLITAGREGMSVLGIEQLNEMGGTGTSGSVCYYYFGAKGGLYEEIDDKAAALREGLFCNKSRRDTKALILDREARACGARIKYNCIVTGIYLEENRVVGLRLFQNGSVISVSAEKFIDATGEAGVCHMAGCESQKGREFDGQAQPVTSVSILVNREGQIVSTNKDAGFADSSDPREISRVMIRSNTFPMYLKEDYTGEENIFLGTAPLFGVREGRLLKGRKVLKMQDVVGMKEQESSPLFYTFCNLDNHGKDMAFENEEMCDWMVASGLWGVLLSVPIPLEALLPDGLENIMVAGRCLSVDHNLAAGIRTQRDMQKCGEAAAYVCCEAIRKKILLSEVEYNNIVDKLRENRCLDEENAVGFMERVPDRYFGEPLPELTSAEEIMEGLAGEKPGWAIWNARVLADRGDQKAEREQLLAALKQGLGSEDEMLSGNAALALGLMGEKCAVGKLRTMAAQPDNYVPRSSLKYLYTRGVSAIYLLGKAGDPDSEELLFQILERQGRTELKNFTYGEFYNHETDVFSQYILFSARALVSIAKADPEHETRIIRRLLSILEDPDYRILITLRDNSASLHDLKPKLMEYIFKAAKGIRQN